jgi:hypothetical protein
MVTKGRIRLLGFLLILVSLFIISLSFAIMFLNFKIDIANVKFCQFYENYKFQHNVNIF